MLDRHSQSLIEEALADTPVVFLAGPRQSGKSTLASQLCKPSRFHTLDDPTLLEAAQSDPIHLLDHLDDLVVLDEVQHLPELFRTMKFLVDRDRRPGRFLLTGSANPLLLTQTSESLAGRMEILTLYPLAASEIAGQPPFQLESLFADTLPFEEDYPPSRLSNQIAAGGFPKARGKKWFDTYLDALIFRDIASLSQIDRLRSLSTILSLVAIRTGGLFRLSELSRATGVPATTLRRYLDLLETLYLVHFLPPWLTNRGKRIVKSPKLYLGDTGLLCHLLGLNGEGLDNHPQQLRLALENYIVNEIQKLASWSNQRISLHHFRLESGREVDLVLEEPNGKVVGLEIKASHVVRRADFQGLTSLQELSGERFTRGIVLYQGDRVISFGERLHAIPISAILV